MKFRHESVMPNEIVTGLLTDTAGIYVDCTLGGAGHAFRIAEKLQKTGRIIGIDRDADAIDAAREKLADAACRIDIVRGNFSRLDDILSAQNAELVDGVLFDLGVSSHQIDTSERGFSYMRDAKLDMRMDTSQKFSAYDVVNGYDEKELVRIFSEYGEERRSKKIAATIVAERKRKNIATTGELAEIISRVVPKAEGKRSGHPAKKVFQAIRIEVNGELAALEKSLRAAVNHLKSGGRIAVISFHSLEDRIVKRTFKQMASGCICPPNIPVCVCNHKPEIKLLGKPVVPSDGEIEKNSRAASAKLRLAQKI